MADMRCAVCDSDKVTKDSGALFPCDSCGNKLHLTCAGLTTSEGHVLDLKSSRQLLFYCKKCSTGVQAVPNLIQSIQNLCQKVDMLASDLALVKQNINSSTSMESYMFEWAERQKRTHNLIMLNCGESNNTLPANRLQHDKSQATEILESIENIDLGNAKFFRRGKRREGHVRPLCITLNNPADVIKILKKKKGADLGDILIFADHTEAQNRYFKEKTQELERLKAEGLSKRLVFRNNIPFIIDDIQKPQASGSKNY